MDLEDRHEIVFANKHVKAVTVITATGAIALSLWFMANLVDGRLWLAVQNIALALGYAGCCWLNRQGRHRLAATIAAALFLVQMAFALYVFGYSSGSFLFFLPGAILPYLMFTRDDLRRAHLFAAVSTIGFIASLVFQDVLPVRIVVGSVKFMEIFNGALVLAILLAAAISFVHIVTNGEEALGRAHRRANQLLLNVLPEEIAERLKTHPGITIADRYENVSVMFVDIANFTAKAGSEPPEETVAMLNKLFTAFDQVCEKTGVEKIRTIGDGYMAVAGVPKDLPNHQHKMIASGLEFLQIAKRQGVDIRIGVHCGPVVAGIVGQQRFQFDIWGDTVNVAARMENSGETGKIHLSKAVFDVVKDEFYCVERGSIPIKGKVDMTTWFIEDKKPRLLDKRGI